MTIIDQTQPVGKINPQNQNSPPYPIQNVLMDDSKALMDDPVALMGALTTPVSATLTSAGSNAPVGSINQRR